MAISGSCDWEVRVTGNAQNGGFFNRSALGINYSLQGSSAFALTGITSAGAGDTILWAGSASSMIGNGLFSVSGTNYTLTNPWFEIIAASDGLSLTLSTNSAGASISTGVGANGVMNIGGAVKLGGALGDDVLLEQTAAGNKWWLQGGSSIIMTTSSVINIAAGGGSQNPNVMEAYDVTRGDKPAGSRRPIIDCSSSALTFGANWDVFNTQFKGSAASVVILGAGSKMVQCKSLNVSATPGRNAVNALGSDNLLDRCEAQSYRGRAVNAQGAGNIHIMGCWLRDSDTGALSTLATNSLNIINTLITGCVSKAVSFTGANVQGNLIYGCTLYGSENKVGTGVDLATGITDFRIMNSILYGFASAAVAHADSQSVGFDAFNNYFNNTTNTTNWRAGSTSVFINPQFLSVGQIVASSATITNSSNALTLAGATFITSGVVAGRDFVYLVNTSAFVYGIAQVVSETQINLDMAPGNSAGNVLAQITINHNFAVGSSTVGTGYPGTFPGGLTTSYNDVGAVQRLEDYPPNTMVLSSVIFANSSAMGQFIQAGSAAVVGQLTPLGYGPLGAYKGAYHQAGSSDIKLNTAYGPSSSFIGALVSAAGGTSSSSNSPLEL